MKTYKQDNMTIHNADCMEIMAGYEDNYFDLAVIDPPFGIGADKKNNGPNSATHERTSKAIINTYKKTNWDSEVPTDAYFLELKRVSKRQIIWGANYFNLQGGMLYWHKNVTMPTYSTGELAHLSWLNKVDYFEYTWHGMLQGDMKNKEKRIHQTQKPIALYNWIYANYAEPGQKILDTHGGSFSNAIAAHYAKMHFVGCELDADYYNAAIERIRKETRQQEFNF